MSSPIRLDPIHLRQRLREELGEHKAGMWFGESTLLEVDGASLRITAGSPYAADWIGRHFTGALRRLAHEATGRDVPVSVSSRDGGAGGIAATGRDEPRSSAKEASERKPDRFGGGTPEGREWLEPPAADDRPQPLSSAEARRTSQSRAGGHAAWRRLEEFVVGDSNRLAFSVAERAAAGGGREPILFIHGECGVGKTHLLQGICRRRRECRPGDQVRCLTGEQFTNEFIASVRSGSIEGFRKRCRRLDLLAIDDVHFLSNKTATQAEFLHTLDAIALGGATVVLASDEHPRAIGRLSRSLVSRFLAGLVVGVGRPDRETRLVLLRRLAAARGLRLGEAAEQCLASRYPGSARDLEGAIARLAAIAALEETTAAPIEVGMVLVERLASEESCSSERTPIRFAAILEAVSEELAVPREELLSDGRRREAVAARGLAAYIARKFTSMSYPEIARGLGRRNHSAIHAAESRVRERLEGGVCPRDAELRERFDRIAHRLLHRG